MYAKITSTSTTVSGIVQLPGSKSLSNRALIIRALASEHFPIEGLSEADDTRVLKKMLETEQEVYDAGHGGTTFRFLAALLAFREGSQVLTGSERMQQRPIGVLVDALRQLGADIEYLGKPDCPPILIKSPRFLHKKFDKPLTIKADVSSQFISALLMVGPTLPGGLALELEGKVVSQPYISMTIRVMEYFGAKVKINGKMIFVEKSPYRAGFFQVERDWSAASYFYEIAAMADSAELFLPGLRADSLQGDAVIGNLMQPFGVLSTLLEDGAILKKQPFKPLKFGHDFSGCPDLAQTMAIICANFGVSGTFDGLETLSVKETDRTAALRAELCKVGVDFEKARGHDHRWELNGKVRRGQLAVAFETYQDHRMAMSLAPLAMSLGTVFLENPSVVEKSFPGYWEELRKLGFEVD